MNYLNFNKNKNRSEEINDIVGNPPHWIVNWGISIILLSIIVLLLGSWIIRYPEIISSRIKIINQNPSVKIIANSKGKIKRIFKKNKETVYIGEHLAYLEDNANYDNVISLRNFLLNSKVQLLNANIQKEKLVQFSNLGQFESSYSSFLTHYKELFDYNNSKLNANLILSTKNSITLKKKIGNELNQKLMNLKLDYDIYIDRLKSDSILFEDSRISLFELNETKSIFIEKKLKLNDVNIAMLNNKNNIEELEIKITNIRKDEKEKRKILKFLLENSFSNILDKIDNWEHQFILKSPIVGVISYFKFWSINQSVDINEEVFVISPVNEKFIGKIIIDESKAGKVQKGQKVIIKIDSYPYEDFGAIYGFVKSISVISQDSLIILDIELLNDSTTNLDYNINLKNGMQGRAEIVLENTRFIQRVLNKFYYFMKKNK